MMPSAFRNLAACLLLCAVSIRASCTSADWVFFNAELVGAAQLDHQALAVSGDRIVAIGSNHALKTWVGEQTRVIDAKGRSLIPGLIDSHIHAIRAGLTETVEVKWVGVQRLSLALDLLRRRAEESDDHDWVVVAGGWTPEQFEERRSPTLAELKEAVGERAAYIQRAYTAVLITPEGMNRLPWAQHADLASQLRAELNAQGQETGWLTGTARTISSVYDLLPPPNATQQREGSALWYAQLARWGITGVLDPGGYNLPPQALAATQRLWREGQLPIRVRFSLSAPRAHQELSDFVHLTTLIPMGWGDGLLRFNGLGENVTWGMYNNSRPSVADKQELHKVLEWAARQAMTVTFHWNDDETVGHLLEVIERVQQQHDIASLRWSIAHLNNASKDHLHRMKKLGMGWLVQNAAYFQRPTMLSKWGFEALQRSPPLGDAIELGLPVGLGTDAHRVMDPNPFVCLQWAIDGRSIDGQLTRTGQHLLTREQALQAYTQGSAWFSHEEHQRGRLTVGQLADLALLNDSYLRIETSRIHTLNAILTLVGGRAVHDTLSTPHTTQGEKK